jgi:tetratricopeptide (TPR) repeat protein
MIETLYDLGKASALENRLDAAEKTWLEVIRLDDTSELAASAHLQLSLLYRKQGKLAEADGHLQRYREMEKNRSPR